MNEQMMAWTDDQLMAEYFLNLRLNAEAEPDEARYSYETIEEVREVAKARGVDLYSKFNPRLGKYLDFSPEQIQAEYEAIFFKLPPFFKPEHADMCVSLEALFRAADDRGIEIVHPERGKSSSM